MFRRRKQGKPVGPWYFHHPVTGRKVSSGTTDKARAAQKLRDLENEAFDRASGRYVERWEETAERWMDLNQHLANYRSQQDYHAFWLPHFTGLKLGAIDETMVHSIIRTERKGRYAVSLDKRTSANATANNYVKFVAKILRYGNVTPPKFHLYPVVKQSKGALRPEQWATLRDDMRDDLRLACTFALATGLRIENVIAFEWDWLHDDKAFLPASVTKTADAYGIPLNRSAQAVIAEVKKQAVRHQRYVFTHRGQQWKYPTLLEAVKRASSRAISLQVTPHWFRHTFRSWLAQQGVADSVARRLGCWQLGKGADAKYLHFDVEPLRPFAEALDPLVSLLSHPQVKAVTNQ